MKKILSAILACSILLSGCGHIRQLIPQQTPVVQITNDQFDCSPIPQPLPSDETLKTWTDRNLFDAYSEAYQWGERCNNLLQANKDYFEKVIKNRDPNAQPPKKPVDRAP